jgi:hypothetical protein
VPVIDGKVEVVSELLQLSDSFITNHRLSADAAVGITQAGVGGRSQNWHNATPKL